MGVAKKEKEKIFVYIVKQVNIFLLMVKYRKKDFFWGGTPPWHMEVVGVYSELHLRLTPQLTAKLDPQPTE